MLPTYLGSSAEAVGMSVEINAVYLLLIFFSRHSVLKVSDFELLDLDMNHRSVRFLSVFEVTS